MNYRIVFENGTKLDQPIQATPSVTPIKSGRDWRRIDVICDVDTAKSLFVDNAKYRQEWDSIKLVEETKPVEEVKQIEDPETGKITETTELVEVTELVETTETLSRDLSDFCVAGEIVDHRDGTCTVLMGKMTEIESLQAQLRALQSEKNSENI